MRSRVAVSFIVLALMAVACGGAPAASPGASAPASQAPSAEPPASAAPVADTLQMHWLGDCTCIWHPAAYETFSQAINFEMMFSTLIDRGWEGDSWTPIPDLADSWEISPDGLVWTFHLHPGVLWHDGTPFTASDIEFTINRLDDARRCASPGQPGTRSWAPRRRPTARPTRSPASRSSMT